ncbi:hypothetical protein PUR57_02510 [Streptomyces sp. JV176]|uniref:hypothetical protein n=1 Tax=Streptomyces sp. JV176 TaxID=858630 RepID=UPI002E76DF49|nr:hypothetical protein [Streptomyces sp. JV176]MEE1797567.1 hypothetical protein [Streptomyces sp. JV176]
MIPVNNQTSGASAPSAGTILRHGGRPSVLEPGTLPRLLPYTPPLARVVERCPCGGAGATCEESMCRPCRRRAVALHGQRLARLLKTITYDH